MFGTGVLERAKKLGIRVVRMWPSVRKEIDSKMKKLNEDFEIDQIKRTKGLDFITTLPEGGLPRGDILKLVERYVYAGESCCVVQLPSDVSTVMMYIILYADI